MTKSQKPVRKRKPPTQLILSDEFKQHMEARMKSEEGKRALNEFAGIIADWAFEQMPTDLMRALVEDGDHETLKELWARHRQRLLQSSLQSRSS